MTGDPLQPLLDARGVVVLDGGTATTLERAGHDLAEQLWSARLLHDDPGPIRDVHRAFLEVGADVVITASYQATAAGFVSAGIAADRVPDLLVRSVELGREACEAAERSDALVAASIGPYGAALGDGSEYRGDYGRDRTELAAFHRDRLTVLSAAGADLLAIETIPSAPEAEVLLELLEEVPGPPAWMTFVGRDEATIADGTPLIEVAGPALRSARVLGVGVNCTPPGLVAPLLRELQELPGHRVVYPNLGDAWDATRRRWRHRDRIPFPAVDTWREFGAHVIGGCCGTTPAHIGQLVRHLGRGD